MTTLALNVSTVSPLRDRVFLKASKAEEKTTGGILLPDTAQEKPQIGTVVSVGPGTRNKDGSYLPMDIQVNDKVLYSKFAGTDLKLGNEDYVLVREQDILAIIT